MIDLVLIGGNGVEMVAVMMRYWIFEYVSGYQECRDVKETRNPK